jgi:nucleotide-binding universal stress UspA family protein
MSIYRKVLIAIDGSEPSMYALREYIRYSKPENPDITVVTVIPPYEGDLAATWTNNITASIKKQCDASLSEAVKIAKGAGITIQALCEEGAIHEKIVDLADMENYDLIVMGKKGLSLIERAFVGSVTARVIGYSRQDVLVIPHEAKVACNNLLIATDGSVYSEAAAMKAFKIARQYHSKVKALSVVDVSVEFMIRAQEVYKSLVEKAGHIANSIKTIGLAMGVDVDPIVRDGEVYKTIIDVAKEYQTDMIVMGSLGKSGIKRLLMGSTAERVLSHASFPVLIVKP